MYKKIILACIPLAALLFTIFTPLISIWGFGANLIDFFDGYAGLAICFIIVGLGVACCGFVGKFVKWAPYLMLLPFLWLLIAADGHIGAGAWFWIILTIVEIVLCLVLPEHNISPFTPNAETNLKICGNVVLGIGVFLMVGCFISAIYLAVKNNDTVSAVTMFVAGILILFFHIVIKYVISVFVNISVTLQDINSKTKSIS